MPVDNENLKNFVSRIERLNEEKSALAADIREVYAELKHFGYDAKILRKIITMRKMETSDRQEQEALIDTYMGVLGMLPLFENKE